MTPIDIAGLVSFGEHCASATGPRHNRQLIAVISMVSIPPLLLILVPHSMPQRFSGIASSQRLTAASFSVLICTLLFAGQSVLDAKSRGGTGSTACAVDALL